MDTRTVSEQLAAAHSHSQSCTTKDSVASLASNHSRSLSSSNKTVPSIPPNLLPSAPASPPTPAPSPTPHHRPPLWASADEDDDAFLLNARIQFSSLSNPKKQRFLEGILGLCDSQNLSFVSSYVGPRLRKDPFLVFPNELCLRVSVVPGGGRRSCPPELEVALIFSPPSLGSFVHRRPQDPRTGISSVIPVARSAV